MNRQQFREIRLGLLLTQKELATLLGYAHKIRVSEFERVRNPVPIPPHIAAAMTRLYHRGERGIREGSAVREWTREAAE